MENTNCYIFAFATFGHPNDFRQTPFKYGNPEIAKQVKVFDLSNAIKVFPNSTIYSIRKESIRSSKLISYSIYSFAQEQASKRDGTFIGSSIILENAIADEKYVLNCLNEFHQKLTENNLNNGIIKVNHSKDFVPISNLNDFDKIENPQIPITDLNFNSNNKSLVVYCDISSSKMTTFFSKSIDLLNIYDTIYFTNSDEVAKFVMQKGIFKLIQNVGERKDFDREINNLIEERKRQREQSIVEFEREIQLINEERNRTIQEFKNQIDHSEKTHNENSRKIKETKEDLNKINQFYENFLNKTRGLINQLRNNNIKLEEVKQIHNSNKNLFNNCISELKTPNYITAISKPKPRGNLHTEPISQDFNDFNIKKSSSLKESTKNTKKLHRYKIATFILTFLLLNTWIYVLFIKFSSHIQTERYENKKEVINMPQDETQPQEELKEHDELNPSPNSQLNENDYRIVAKNLKYNLKVEEVVKVIFDKNPTEIRNYYTGQEKNYYKQLIEKNKDCFENIDGVIYFKKDTIRNIPSFKKGQ